MLRQLKRADFNTVLYAGIIQFRLTVSSGQRLLSQQDSLKLPAVLM